VTELEIKRRVRERDGNCCTKCGLTSDKHIAKYGKGLEVHRVIPGSEYTLEGCVTLCKSCHGYQIRGPRRERPVVCRETLLVMIEPALRERIDRASSRFQISVGAYIRLATTERLERDEAAAPKKRNGH
jgi:hypothetical protein